MIAVNLRIRPAVSADLQQIADLILFEQRIYRHLDWRAPLEWLAYRPFFVLEKDGRIAAALACPPDPPSIFSIRLFAFHSSLSGPSAWSPLWDATRCELVSLGGATVAAIVTQHWFESILIENGFALSQHIVLLEWNRQPFKPYPAPAGITLRPMILDDLPRVAEVDAAAFEPLWQNSLPALSKAFSQAIYPSVAEDKSGLVGYQLSTGNPFGAHLAASRSAPKRRDAGLHPH